MDKTGNIKLSKAGRLVQKYLCSFSQQLANQSGKPLRGAGIPSKPRDVEHLTKVRDKWT